MKRFLLQAAGWVCVALPGSAVFQYWKWLFSHFPKREQMDMDTLGAVAAGFLGGVSVLAVLTLFVVAFAAADYLFDLSNSAKEAKEEEEK